MVYLDHQLIFNARHLINGANVHRVKELIFLYEQSVLLHNIGWPALSDYDRQYECRLRMFVFQERMKGLLQDAAASPVSRISFEIPNRQTMRKIRRAARGLVARGHKLVK